MCVYRIRLGFKSLREGGSGIGDRGSGIDSDSDSDSDRLDRQSVTGKAKSCQITEY